jgi:hypothetical protein
MEEYGQTHVSPAQPPDLLASITGQRLANAALLHGPHSAPHLGGIWLRFETENLLAAAVADEWFLSNGNLPSNLLAGRWLLDNP